MSKIIKAFETKVSNAIFDVTLNIAGVYIDDNGNEAEAWPGTLCIRTERTLAAGYKGHSNVNTWYMQNAEAQSAEVYALNSFNVAEHSILGMEYRISPLILGVSVPAGVEATYTKMKPGDIHKFGLGNFKSKPENQKYAGISNGQLEPMDSKPADGIAFEILEPESYTSGNRNGGEGYLVRVIDAAQIGVIPDPPVVTTPTDTSVEAVNKKVTFEGTCATDAAVKVYVDGNYISDATVSSNSWTYTLDVIGDSVLVWFKQTVNGIVSAKSTIITVTNN